MIALFIFKNPPLEYWLLIRFESGLILAAVRVWNLSYPTESKWHATPSRIQDQEADVGLIGDSASLVTLQILQVWVQGIGRNGSLFLVI
jgi:hypothetical protein